MISNVESQALDTPNTELKPCADDQIHDDHVWVASKHFHCLGRTTTKAHDRAMDKVQRWVTAAVLGTDSSSYSVGSLYAEVIYQVVTEEVTTDEVIAMFREKFQQYVDEAVRRFSEAA
jgi:hypothetical protein